MTPREDQPSVLIVDDDASIRDLIQESIQQISHCTFLAPDLTSARATLAAEHPDLIICDISLPDGCIFQLLNSAEDLLSEMGIIVITGGRDSQHFIRALRLHVSDFLLKPFTLENLQESVRHAYAEVVEKRKTRKNFETIVARLQRRNEQIKELHSKGREQSLETLVATLDAREHDTCAHSFRVRAYSVHIAECAGCSREEIETIEHAALLHDIGKIAAPDNILLKPGKLLPKEKRILEKHSITGENLLARSGFFRSGARIVRHHHERWDGVGYPDGLPGMEIPLGSRIFAVADTLDAITSDRIYRKARSLREARQEILDCSASQFDPMLCGVFESIPNEKWRELRLEAEGLAQKTLGLASPLRGNKRQPQSIAESPDCICQDVIG